MRNKDPRVGKHDRPLVLLCRDKEFSVVIKLVSSKKKKRVQIFDPRELGCHSLVSELRYTNT